MMFLLRMDGASLVGVAAGGHGRVRVDVVAVTAFLGQLRLSLELVAVAV